MNVTKHSLQIIKLIKRRCVVNIRTFAIQNVSTEAHAAVSIFDRKTKHLQRERVALSKDAHLYDYLKEEIGYRLADRVRDVKRQFEVAADIGCNRGYVSRHITIDSVNKLILCDMNESFLNTVPVSPEVHSEKRVMDEENINFEPNSLDLVISNLIFHWVNDLPKAFQHIMQALKNDGVFMASLFGIETLYELRSALQLADLERRGGISPHVSPFADVQDIGSLLNRAGFTMLTIDTDEIVVRYPSMFHLMEDLKGMGENNAAQNRSLHLHRDVQLAAASVYEQLYGSKMKESGEIAVPATFQVIYLIAWKPDASQPKPLQRGTGEFSLKDLYKLDEIIEKTQKTKDDISNNVDNEKK